MKKTWFLLFVSLVLPALTWGSTQPDRNNRSTYGKELSLQKIPGPKRASAVELFDGKLYVSGDGRLYIYDVSAPRAPRLLSEISGLHQSRQLAVKPGLVGVSARSHGVWLIDVKDAAHPKMLPLGDAIELATGIDMAGDLLFLGNRVYGIEIQDISNPASPRYLSRFKTNEAQSVRYVDGKLFSGDWGGGLITIIDVSNPYQPVELAKIKLDGYGDGIAVRDNLVFAATGHHRKSGPAESRFGNGHGLEIHDISNIRKPVRLSRIEFPTLWTRANDFWTVRVAGNYAFVADTYNGFFLIDISNPKAPKPVAWATLEKRPTVSTDFNGVSTNLMLPDPMSGIAVGDGVVYITGANTGLFMIELPGIAQIEPLRKTPMVLPPAPPPIPNAKFFTFNPGGQVRSVAIRGDLAWVAATRGGLHLVKLTGNGIIPVRKWDIPYAFDAQRHGKDLLIVAEGEAGVNVYRIVSGNQLVKLGAVKLPGNMLARQLWVPAGSRFAIASGNSGLIFFIDLVDPQNPKVVRQYGQISLVYGDLITPELVGGKYLFQNWHSGGFAWYDLSGDKPEVANLDRKRLGAGHLDGATTINDKVLLTMKGGYVLLAPNQPGPAEQWPVYRSSQYIGGIPRTDGNILVTSQRATGDIRVFDISNIRKPKPIPARATKLSGNPGAVEFWKGKMVIPAGNQGLLLEK